MCCSVLFSVGLISGLFAKDILAKLVLAFVFFFIISYNARNKLAGRVVYGGMEKPFIFSLGASMFFLGSLFISQKMEFMIFAIPCYAPGLYYFYRGYSAGPHHGWENYFRKIN